MSGAGDGGLPSPVPGVGDVGLPSLVSGAGDGGLPSPVPGVGDGCLPSPAPGTGDSDLPSLVSGARDVGLPSLVSGAGDGGLPSPVPGVGDVGLPSLVSGACDGGVPSPVPGVGDGCQPSPAPGTGDSGLPSLVSGAGDGGRPSPAPGAGDGGPSDPVQMSVDYRGQCSRSIPTKGDGRRFFRSVAISLDGSLQSAERDQITGEIVYKLASLSETAQADNLRSRAVAHICQTGNIPQDEAALSADMPPNLKFKTLIDRIEHMSNPLSKIGEHEVQATAEVVGRNIHVIIEGHSSRSNVMYR